MADKGGEGDKDENKSIKVCDDPTKSSIKRQFSSASTASTALCDQNRPLEPQTSGRTTPVNDRNTASDPVSAVQSIGTARSGFVTAEARREGTPDHAVSSEVTHRRAGDCVSHRECTTNADRGKVHENTVKASDSKISDLFDGKSTGIESSVPFNPHSNSGADCVPQDGDQKTAFELTEPGTPFHFSEDARTSQNKAVLSETAQLDVNIQTETGKPGNIQCFGKSGTELKNAVLHDSYAKSDGNEKKDAITQTEENVQDAWSEEFVKSCSATPDRIEDQNFPQGGEAEKDDTNKICQTDISCLSAEGCRSELALAHNTVGAGHEEGISRKIEMSNPEAHDCDDSFVVLNKEDVTADRQGLELTSVTMSNKQGWLCGAFSWNSSGKRKQDFNEPYSDSSQKSLKCNNTDDIPFADDEGQMPSMGQVPEDPFLDNTEYALKFRIRFTKDNHTCTRDYQYSAKIALFRWKSISKRVIYALRIKNFEESMEKDEIIIKGALPLREPDVETRINQTYRQITELLEGLKSKKIKTGPQTEMIQQKLLQKYRGEDLHTTMSTQKQRLLMLSSDVSLLSGAEKYVLDLQHDRAEIHQHTRATNPGGGDSCLQGQGQMCTATQGEVQGGTTLPESTRTLTSTKQVKQHGSVGTSDNSSSSACQEFDKKASTKPLQKNQEQNKEQTSEELHSALADDRRSAVDGKKKNQPVGSSSPDSQKMKIDISKTMAGFLCQQEILLEFQEKLLACTVWTETKTLRKCYMEVLKQDETKLSGMLRDMLTEETFKVGNDVEEVKSMCSDIFDKFGEKFFYDVDKDALGVAYHTSIAAEIQPYIADLKYVKKRLPLPVPVVRYVLHHKVLNELKKDFEGSGIQIDTEENGEGLLVKTLRADFPEVEKNLNKLLARVYQNKIEVSVDCGRYLQSCAGMKERVDVEQRNGICLDVHNPSHVLKVRSPGGDQVMVCKGSIAATDCQVMVLPLCERKGTAGQIPTYEELSPVVKHLLERGYLSTDPKVYAAALKPPETSTLSLKCQGPAAGKQIVLMHVPFGTASKFKDHVRTAIKKALQSAVSEHTSPDDLCIALPLSFGVKEKEWKAILPAIQDALEAKRNKTVTVELYLGYSDSGETLPKLVTEMKSFLTGHKEGWVSGASLCRDPQQNRVSVVVGSILDKDILDTTDVLVNTTDPDLLHTKGKVSNKLLEIAGEKLTAECRMEYPKGLTGDSLVAVTNSHGLKPVKNIFHVVLSQDNWNISKSKHEEEIRLEELRARMMSCLALASAKQYQKIAFPTLGTGKLSYPADRVANTMFATAQDFFACMPHSSLQEVKIVCFPGDKQIIEAFQQRESLTTELPSQQRTEPKGKKGRKLPKTPPQNAEVAILDVCGEEQGVKKAVKQILDMKVPKYDQCFEDSAVDPPGYGMSTATEADEGAVDNSLSLPLDSDMCSFTIPLKFYTKEFADALHHKEIMELLEQISQVEQPVSSKCFLVKYPNLERVVMHLTNITEVQKHSVSHSAPESKKEKEKKWSRCLHHHEVSALSYMIGQDFEEMFTTKIQNGDQVKIECVAGPPSDEISKKVDSLRKEELQLPKSEVLGLGQPFSTRQDGVDAFVLPVPDEGKVIIFSFDYNTLSKAKHLVNVKLGKVKVTTRSKRRFDGTGPDSGGSITDQSPPGSLRSTSPYTVPGAGAATSEVVLTTKSGVKVSVYKTDITKLPVDAIVNAANEHLKHGGGVAYAISKAAGFQLEEEGDAYIRKHGPLKVTEVGVTSAGSLPCKKVLHAVGPRWADYKDKSLCQSDLTSTVFNCLKTATELGLSSLAVSSISSAIFGVPKEVCAESYLSAVHGFDDQYGGSSSIKHVHFVDVNDTMVDVIGRTFSQKWDKPISIAPLQVPVNAYNGEEAKTRQWNTERSAGTRTHRDMISTRGNAHREQINQTASGASFDYSRSPTRVNSDFNLSDPGSKSTHESRTRSSHLGEPTANRSESQLRETKELQKGAYGLETRGSEQQPQSQGITPGRPQIERIAPGGEAQYQVHFGGLDLILQRQSITHVVTDFIVLWQSYGSVLQDVHSQNVIKLEGNRFQNKDVALLKDKLQKGEMVMHSLGSRQHLLLQVIDAADAVNREKLGQIIQNMLEKVQSMGRRTVVMPTLKATKINKASRFTTAQFAAGVYLAIRKHMERSPRPVSEVHIVDSDGDYLKDLAEAFNVEMSLDMSSRQPEQGRNGENQKRSMGLKCPVCLETPKQPTSLDKCGHTFCTDCIAACFKTKPVCPECQTIYGIIYGDQPKDGKMKMKRKSFSLPTYKEPETFVIEYDFPNGIRDGSKYKGITSRTAFLPNTLEGRKVLMLLKTAFDRGLVFTVGQSATIPSEELRVTWNGIHHKTDKNEGADYGYPDPTYLNRVQEELAARGVTLQDLTSTQTQFIDNPERFYPRITPHGDFGDQFDKKQKNSPWK